jgi:DNA-binding IclR family transcriptional regulator
MLGIGKSNVHRLLNTMIELGFVRKDADTRMYLPTLKTWELGSMVAERNELRRVARPVMLELLDQLGETIYLSILNGADLLYLEQFLSARSAKTKPTSGTRVPAPLTASGRVLLAFHPDGEMLAERSREVNARLRTVDKATLMEEFKTIRNQGYAASESVLSRGYNSIAVPVIQEDRAVAALGMGLFADQYSLSEIVQFVPRLTRAANEISASLGSRVIVTD